MELTEQQALEIAYMIFPSFKNRRYIFRDERNEPTPYSYELFIYRGRSFDGHRTTSDVVTFSFDDARSRVTDDGGAFLDITGEVKNYLEQHKAGVGL